MRKVCVVLLVTVLSVLLAPTSFAHVLVPDSSGKTGAVLHTISDDDPIAGEISSLYFDMQDTIVSEKVKSVNVAINSDKNEGDSLDMKIDGSLATAKYMFPLQGRYDMTFTVTTQSQQYVYRQVQRVSRGETDGVLKQVTHPWAEAVLIGCGAVFMIGCILLWNHRRELWRGSTF